MWPSASLANASYVAARFSMIRLASGSPVSSAMVRVSFARLRQYSGSSSIIALKHTPRAVLSPSLRPGTSQEFLSVQVCDNMAEQVRRHWARQWLAVDRHLDPSGITDPHGEAGFVRQPILVSRSHQLPENYVLAVLHLQPTIVGCA